VKLLLVDKSAYVRGPLEVDEDYELCLCAATQLELLYSARSARDFERLEVDVSHFRDLRMDTATFAVALGAQRELAASGHHRVSIPDLLIASCAHQHGADVAHADRHFEVLERVLVFRSVHA
jgi:predicted nucleic acid-binding protein